MGYDRGLDAIARDPRHGFIARLIAGPLTETVAVLEGVLEAAEEAGVLGVVVGANAEELGELGDDSAAGVLDEGSVAGRTGVATGSAVAVGGDPVFGDWGDRL